MTRLNRIATCLREASIAMQDPTRADAVAAVGELTGTLALQQLQKVMREHRVGNIILQEQPLVSKETIPYQLLLDQVTQPTTANQQQEDYKAVTFGQAYIRFLQTHDFDPDDRSPIQYLLDDDDPELAYILLRYRQSHDFYHVLTGLPPTVVGELALKWLEFFQTGLPMTAMAGVVGIVGRGGGAMGNHQFLSTTDQYDLWNIYIPWAIRVGKYGMAPFGTLLNVYYEKEWDTPLHELQQRVGIQLAPQK